MSKFIWGGETGEWLKFKTRVIILASQKNGEELWKKDVKIQDFSSVFNSEIIMNSKSKYFKTKKESFISGGGEDGTDSQFLTKEEMKLCALYSLKYALK